MTPEGRVQDDIEVSASSFFSRLLRNNSGALQNKLGAWVRYGLGNISKKLNKKQKSSDLIGWTTITITQAMVGKQIAVFTAIEVKPPTFNCTGNYREGTREWAQENFCVTVRKAYGFAAICNSDEHYKLTMKFFIDNLEKAP